MISAHGKPDAVSRKALWQLVFAAIVISCRAQLSPFTQDTSRHRHRVIAYGVPVVFYTPETRWGYGVSGTTLFNLKGDSMLAPRSSVSLSFIYTQNRQMIFVLPYNLMIANRTWQLYGEVAFNRYFFNFYGVGNDVPASYVERYGIEFPRLRITALRKVVPHFYAGPRYAFDRYSLFSLDSTKLLSKGSVYGSGGGTISGVGGVLLYDSRDNIFYPSRGWWSELVVYRNDALFGGTFNYTRVAFDASRYQSLPFGILAVNVYGIYCNANLPFFQMAMMGGPKKMRGYYEGRYRDNNLLMLQGEYRFPIYQFISGTAFGSVGQVAQSFSSFSPSEWRGTYGGGIRLRLDKNQKINLRFDVAIGNKKPLTYFTVGEAF